VFVYGEPIVVSPEADRSVMEMKRRSLEEALERLTLVAEKLALGGPGR
jgi:hypothetical protein